ncbi:hypothetical protein GCM10010191_67990 [Actinomadura vinacea]|uniref:Integrase n=1 Tax=Actinomadura vinacea TaxID=115336 RepID=A0ABN3JW71_9ACTN
MTPRNDPVGRIEPTDPLPVPPQPQGRWGMPYLTQIGDGYMWTCSTRHVLTDAEKRAGLSQTLVAESESLLLELAAKEDERAAEYKAAEREHSYRNTLL